MYRMYPDWGPARHDPNNPLSRENTEVAVYRALDLRDDDTLRPEDN